MDCTKVGKLILQLRTEKGLTQKQVADRLNITNKTISKWECGLGCPDVSLWEELANVLGADILKLLQGELTPNRPDVGKLNYPHQHRGRFYCLLRTAATTADSEYNRPETHTAGRGSRCRILRHCAARNAAGALSPFRGLCK